MILMVSPDAVANVGADVAAVEVVVVVADADVVFVANARWGDRKFKIFHSCSNFYSLFSKEFNNFVNQVHIKDIWKNRNIFWKLKLQI